MIGDEALMLYIDGEAECGARDEIEDALASDPALRARLERLRANDRELKAAFGLLLETPVPAALVAKVRSKRPAVIRLVPRERELMAQPTPPPLLMTEPPRRRGVPAWAGWAAAAFFALGWMGVREDLSKQKAATYQALGSAPASAAGNAMLMFRPDTSEQQMRAILRSVDGRMVDGPTAADAYVVHLATERRAALLAQLKGWGEIVLAEPIDGEAPK